MQFHNKSINAVSYHWDFGNGQTSTEENPDVIYDDFGVYFVTLTATPHEELHYNNPAKTERLALVGSIFREDFSDPSLAENFPPEGWILIDLDGDGHNWFWEDNEAYIADYGYHIISKSWVSATGEVLTPDNWIITPQIDLTERAGAMLEFDVTTLASGAAFKTEHYAVFISTTGTNEEDFEIVYSETISEDHGQMEWQLREIDISGFTGEQIYVAFRHYNSTDLWGVSLANIHIYETAGK